MENKIRNSILVITTVSFVGILLRVYYFPYDIPFSYDTLDYFAYALTERSIGKFPENVALANNGWPTVVSFFMSISNSNDLMNLTYLQRTLGMSFSILTVIPVYFLARRFFTEKIAVIAPALFILEPNIVINSVSGGTLPIFIFLSTTAIWLFLSNRIKIIIISFAIIGFLSFMRYEGLLLIIPFSIMFFVRYRYEKNELKKYFLMIIVFLLVITPIAALRVEAYGYDGMLSNMIDGIIHVTNILGNGIQSPVEGEEEWVIEGENNIPDFLRFGIINLFKFLGITMLPIFIFFISISIVYLIKQKNELKINARFFSVVFYSLVLLIPAFYIYGRHIEEIRYLFILYPIFALLSLYSIQVIFNKIRNHSLITSLIICGVVVLSLGFIEFEREDNSFDIEAFSIARVIVNEQYGYNTFPPVTKYIKSAEVYDKFHDSIKFDENGHVERLSNRIDYEDHTSIESFLSNSKEKGLTHLIISDRDQPEFLEDVFLNEKKFPYLEKIYDSTDKNFIHIVKIFQINYEIFSNFK
tara:strand:- start:11219 stop:12799 length:1581 start_codon:yes stop_codon:yes gene_type:complete